MKIQDFFYLPKSDRQVLLVLLSLAAIVLLGIYLSGETKTDAETTDSMAAEADSMARRPAAQRDEGNAPQRSKEETDTIRLTRFDPNTADRQLLLRLGLQPWQADNILKYRERGGVYTTKEDFAQLYGLTVKQYRELEPYIHIAPEYRPASSLFKRQPRQQDSRAGGLRQSEARDSLRRTYQKPRPKSPAIRAI